MNTLTLRDHFAVEAMKAMILEPQWDDQEITTAGRIFDNKEPAASSQRILAFAAYALADAMLAERERNA